MRQTSISVRRNNALPVPQVQKAFVRQQVNLRPAGNTVTITTLADNPFESLAGISVVTQASGGMAKPDRMQQSKGLLCGLGATDAEIQAWANKYEPGVALTAEKKAYWASQIDSAKASSDAKWAAAGNVATTGLTKASEWMGMQTAKYQSEAEKARAAAAKVGLNVPSYTPTAPKTNYMPWIIGGVAVVGVVAAFFLLRKKSA
jgi:hypothetical protein